MNAQDSEPVLPADRIQRAEVVLPCAELDQTLGFFVDRLGFRLDAIFPADAPAFAVLSGYGLRLRLDRQADGPAGVLRLYCEEPQMVADGDLCPAAPNGTRIELVSNSAVVDLPPLAQSFVVSRLDEHTEWVVGRAGMRYRDLIPDRQGGRFIASHIHIPDGGPVPDYVHFHRVRFQMIYCYKGWARLVYQDQGPPFVIRAGDCVLQPPTIRHQVLECSDNMEVIEIGCPAQHETHTDHDLSLPNADLNPGRDFDGQRFVRHEADKATWDPWRVEGFECRDLGIAMATEGLAGVRVVRVGEGAGSETCSHNGEFLFVFVLAGSVTLLSEESEPLVLSDGDASVLPSGMKYALAACTADLEFLEVALPALFKTARHAQMAN